MKHLSRAFIALILCLALVGSACSATAPAAETEATAEPTATAETADTTAAEGTATAAEATESALAAVDMSAWQYNADADVYWQVGISYCETPADASYETLGIFVPGAYFTATENGDGTYTCTVNESGTVSGYTAATAPIVIPVNTPGYSAMSAPTGYTSEASTYTAAGFIYLMAGCRGRDAGAPAGVTDLKAAIRYYRYCSDVLPGDTDRIFSFGMSGGGAQSALLGSTGDSELYNAYLEAIGAVMTESDAVCGSMCWCPITNLDEADEAYEWNMGVTRTGLTDDEQAISDALTEAYAAYVNEAGFTDAEGNVLTLTESDDGIYQAGSYYDYILSVIETSLNNFLADTTFPYTASGSSTAGGTMGGRGEKPTGEAPSDLPTGTDGAPSGLPTGEAPTDLPSGTDGAPADLPSGEAPTDLPTGTDGVTEKEQYAADGVKRGDTASSISTDGTYEIAQDYIDALNANGTWVTYDAATNTATVTSVADFVKACKNASKSLGAFDDLDESQAENILFGDGDGSGDHFDAVLASILTGTDYESAYTEDLARVDAQSSSVETRLNMYTPLYYLLESYEGYGTSTVAKYWRINTGINQSDTALCTEVNLALALSAYGCDVDFTTVWGQGHTQAERTGSSSGNFIAWVNTCLAD